MLLKQSFIPNIKLTAVVLNWKRPDNVRKIVNYLVKYDFISEIIVWNNSPIEFELEDHVTKIRVINSKENLRDEAKYLASSEAVNDYVFYQDDDWSTDHYLNALYLAFCLNPKVIHIATGEKTWITHRAEPRKCINPALNLQAEFSYIGTGSMFPKHCAEKHLSYIQEYFTDAEKYYADVAFTLFNNQPFIETQVILSSSLLNSGDDVAFSSQPEFDNEIYKVKVKARQLMPKMSAKKEILPDITVKSVFKQLVLYTDFLPKGLPADSFVFDVENIKHCEPISVDEYRQLLKQSYVRSFCENSYFHALMGIFNKQSVKKGWKTNLDKGDVFGLLSVEPIRLKVMFDCDELQMNKLITFTQDGNTRTCSFNELNGFEFSVDSEVYFTSQEELVDLHIIFHKA